MYICIPLGVSVYVCVHAYIYIYIRIYIYMYVCHIFFIHSSIDGHLDCFHTLAMVLINNAAMNIGMHISF